jgi:hypothetical protein
MVGLARNRRNTNSLLCQVQTLAVATIMIWLGIFVAESSRHAGNMTLNTRQDCVLMLACMMVAPLLGIFGAKWRNITCVRFNAGFNCIGGCIAFTLIGVVWVSLKFAEDYIDACEDPSKNPADYCKEISQDTKDDFMAIHKYRTYVEWICIPGFLCLGLLACVSAVYGRRLASQLQATDIVRMRTPLVSVSELNRATIQPPQRTAPQRTMI